MRPVRKRIRSRQTVPAGVPFSNTATAAATAASAAACRSPGLAAAPPPLPHLRHVRLAGLGPRPAERYCEIKKLGVVYRVSHLVWDLGWVGFDLDVQLYCLAAQPFLINSSLPKHNWADSGATKIKIKATQPMSQTLRPDGKPCICWFHGHTKYPEL